MTAPERSLAQRRAALAKGNRVRTARKNWKADVKRGRASVPALLVRPPEAFETMKVFDVLMAMPKVGRVKANSLLRLARVSPSKTVGGLSDRQRAQLVTMLPRSSGRAGR